MSYNGAAAWSNTRQNTGQTTGQTTGQDIEDQNTVNMGAGSSGHSDHYTHGDADQPARAGIVEVGELK